MKIRTINNNELVIEANQNKEGDYELCVKIAELIDAEDLYGLVFTAAEEGEFVQLCARWNHYQAKEFKEAYEEAKKIVL